MATIISKGDMSASDFGSNLHNDLQTLFDFVKIEDTKLYITNETYILINTNTVTIGNDNGITFTLTIGTNTNNWYKLIKTANGDVAVLANYGEIINGTAFRFAIVKVKNAITNEESYGIFTNSTIGGTSSVNNYGDMLLFTDDVTQAAALTQVARNPNALSSYSTFVYGARTNAPVAVLGDAFSHLSQCITVDFKVMLMTPIPYNGDCLINGKKYYCITYLAMLDE